ncbi:hypothetical protein MTR67_049743 [Solanum verrucosum]|uniref:Jacalin-type lectin domain-containing protein n=1 Tax=Solanum verrucosum TaxID=315347 RepID=A0AAF1A0K2_SOLVR|nr:hypothetical protein MTR67_049743 [Solanum verrucosum]
MNMNITKIGPIGNQKGINWNEGRSEIAKIFVSHIEDKICSLQFPFFENQDFVLSNIHGDTNDFCRNKNFDIVALDYPSEFLTGIKGSFGGVLLSSITFSTNKQCKGSYGPHGCKKASHYIEFNFHIGNDRSFGGFYGTKYGNFIESIGLYVKTITPSMIKFKDSQVKVKKEEEK